MTFSIYLFILILFLCLWLIPQSQMTKTSAYCEFDDTDGDAADGFHHFMTGSDYIEDGSAPFD